LVTSAFSGAPVRPVGWVKCTCIATVRNGGVDHGRWRGDKPPAFPWGEGARLYDSESARRRRAYWSI